MTKCPKCEKLISRLEIDAMSGISAGKSWKCISLNCPFCHTSLGAQIDPVAIHTETLKAIQRS